MDNGRKRPSPYCWVTWITGLLAGTEKCYWKVWLKTHYFLPKGAEDLDRQRALKKWIHKHDDMTARRVAALEAEGYTVTTEDDNAFTLRGEVATLAGKPDIIALKPHDRTGLIIDEKSGRQKEQYIWQVLIYMWAKSLTLPDYLFSGEVEYEDETVPVHPRALSTDNKRRISQVMKLVGGDVEPARVPSKGECQYCEIMTCPDRYVVEDVDATAHF